MSDDEIEKEAKKHSQGNFYYEQGFSYGYELGLAEERKKSKQYIEQLQNEKAELAEDFCKQLAELKTQIEKMKCCENCSKVDTCKLFAHIDISVCDKWSWQNE